MNKLIFSLNYCIGIITNHFIAEWTFFKLPLWLTFVKRFFPELYKAFYFHHFSVVEVVRF